MKLYLQLNKKIKIALAIIICITIVCTVIVWKKYYSTTDNLKEKEHVLTIEKDANGMMKEPDPPTKEGYVFAGWYIEDEKVDFSKPIAGDKKIVAKWEKIEEQLETQPETGLTVLWVEVSGSAIEQCRLYIKNSEGKYVGGILELMTISGTIFEEQVTSNGSENMYIKSAIKSVKIKEVIK